MFQTLKMASFTFEEQRGIIVLQMYSIKRFCRVIMLRMVVLFCCISIPNPNDSRNNESNGTPCHQSSGLTPVRRRWWWPGPGSTKASSLKSVWRKVWSDGCNVESLKIRKFISALEKKNNNKNNLILILNSIYKIMCFRGILWSLCRTLQLFFFLPLVIRVATEGEGETKYRGDDGSGSSD